MHLPRGPSLSLCKTVCLALGFHFKEGYCSTAREAGGERLSTRQGRLRRVPVDELATPVLRTWLDSEDRPPPPPLLLLPAVADPVLVAAADPAVGSEVASTPSAGKQLPLQDATHSKACTLLCSKLPPLAAFSV